MTRQATQGAEPTVTNPGYGRVQTILQVATAFVTLIYFLPLVWHPTPQALLDARQLITGAVVSVLQPIVEAIISVHS